MMTPRRLRQIREYDEWVMSQDRDFLLTHDADNRLHDLLAHVDDLTRQLCDARRIAIDSGAFQTHKGTDYDFEEYDFHDGCMRWRDDSWRADPVGPVAWDKQVQQP